MEGCGYRDLQADFDALGVVIVGVGLDEPADNLAWAEDEGFTYELWTDRRESWLPPFPLARRYARDRDAAGRLEE